MQAGPTTRCLTFKDISVCNLKAIARSSLEETQTTREVMKYEGGEVVTLLPDGKRQCPASTTVFASLNWPISLI